MRRLLLGLCSVFAVVAAPAADDPSSVRFTELLIAGGYGYAYGLAAADLDHDGDLDLTSSDATKNAEPMLWYENDGRGGFTRHFIQKDEAGWCERHAVGDVDNDGHPDVVVVKNNHGHIVWFRNNGTPRDDKLWQRFVISTDIQRAYDVALADLDGDGDLDVAASAWVGNYFAWFENPGKPAAGGAWAKHLVAENLAETRTICVADFNGDGKPDLLGTARVGGLTAWFENSGQPKGSPWKQHGIDARSAQPVHGHPVDMDRDGDMDVVMALGMVAGSNEPNTHRVVWYENVGRPGKGIEWESHEVGKLLFGFEAVAGDLDDDGDIDVVATSWNDYGRVAWFENSGNPKGAWNAHTLKSPWCKANQPIIADLNGDKRPDIAATAENGSNELRWWRNDGRSDSAADTSR